MRMKSLLGAILIVSFSFGVVSLAQAGVKYETKGAVFSKIEKKILDVEFLPAYSVNVFAPETTVKRVYQARVVVASPLIETERRCNSPPTK